MAKVGTSNLDRTISLKKPHCVVENKHKHKSLGIMGLSIVKYFVTCLKSSFSIQDPIESL